MEMPRPAAASVLVRGTLRFACHDVRMFDDAYHEVFDEQVYRFSSSTDHPYIIDAGANLGLATCYFKTRHPGATVLAFEPDPRMCSLYARNVHENGFDGVTLQKTALAGQSGVARLFGDVTAAAPHALGNSLREEWGVQQPDSSAVDVRTEPLSPYLDRAVDLLKLDIEGMEAEVLSEAASCLGRVRQIRMEVHQTRMRPHMLADVDALLRSAGFDVRIEPRPLRELLPPAAMPWFERERPEIFVLAAGRSAR
jgi:FkbM family methyltransferase